MDTARCDRSPLTHRQWPHAIEPLTESLRDHPTPQLPLHEPLTAQDPAAWPDLQARRLLLPDAAAGLPLQHLLLHQLRPAGALAAD